MKITEDETITLLKDHLEKIGWHIGEKFCLGQKHGIDIEASKGKVIMLIEAKGARANDTAPTKRRVHFDSGQIKTHFGKAIVKMLHEKSLNPKAKLAIAHPDDEDIRTAIGHIIVNSGQTDPLRPF
jgi:hypothetical protein